MIAKSSCFALVAVLSALGVPTTLSADDSALYPEALPADAAFFRTLSDQTPPVIDGVHVQSFDAKTCRDYCAVSAAQLTSIEPNTFFSLFVGTDGTTRVLEEPARGPASKVNLIVINAGHEPVRLVVPERNLGVVELIEPNESGSRAVNPVSTKLAVVSATDSDVFGVFDLSLSRGQDLTFFVQDGQVELIENAYGPVLSVE